MKRFLKVPSPAMAVALLALVVSMSGVSYAALLVGTSNIKNGAVTSKKIKNHTVKQVDLAPRTVKALKGSARAYGLVEPNPVGFVASRTKGLASVTRPATGIYCLTLTDAGIPLGSTAPVVSVDWGSSSGSNLAVMVRAIPGDCSAGTDVEVRTYSFPDGGGDYTASDSVAFTVLVP